MNYSTEKDDYLMTTPYTKKIQQKFEKVKSFLEQNGFNPSSDSLMQDIVSSEEYIDKNSLWKFRIYSEFLNNKNRLLEKVTIFQ